MEPIGTIVTPFDEKFGTPRQPGLAMAALGRVELNAPWNTRDAVRGLSEFSHIWLIIEFHEVPEEHEMKPTVRPPRLGGNERVGVFASRSPFRPNRLGLSLVKLREISVEKGKATIIVEGVDLVNGTPVIDIKPYLPWVESVPDALGGFADSAPSQEWKIEFGKGVKDSLTTQEIQLIEEVIRLDPRPAYREDEVAEFGVMLAGRNVRWKAMDTQKLAIVLGIEPGAQAG